jgi:hypothetical protein
MSISSLSSESLQKVGELLEEKTTRFVSVIGEGAEILGATKSLCPGCVDAGKYDRIIVDSIIYGKEGMVWQTKYCEEHGFTTEIYWEDLELYKKASRYSDPGVKILNPNVNLSSSEISCPVHCGLCAAHESHTGLGNIVLTNRCNLSCWYCFFYAREGERIYEPSLEQIRNMLRNLRRRKPLGADVVQLTGGEPTLRRDLIDIIRIAKEEGYRHLMVNTNGIRLSQDPELVRHIKEAGSINNGNIILYLSFDGVTPQTNPKNYYEVPGVIMNARKVGLRMVLVPTVIRGVNDHEVGDMVRFASSHLDVVRGVNFQPVSLVGRMPREEREKKRITIPGLIKELEEQLDGIVTREDFFTVPSVCRLTNFMEQFIGEHKYRLSIHFACGMATYLFKENGKLMPITRFLDVEGFLNYLKDVTYEIGAYRLRKAGKALSTMKLLWNIKKYVKKKPKDFDIAKALMLSLRDRSYNPLLAFHKTSLFIGMMHFQDPYNYDVRRVQKCDIHYATPDGRIIPFCAFNVIPELYRDEIQERYSISPEEWERKNKARLKDDKYKRSLAEEEKARIAEFYRRSIEDSW